MSVARVQDAGDGTNGASLTVTLPAAPTAGNLLIAWGNSDALVSIGGSGWNAGPSIIDGNGAYSWWKVAGASEPSAVTFTPSVSDWITAGLLEYSGLTASPLDTSGSAMISGTPSTSTTAVTLTAAADHDLGIALALLHASSPTAEPTAPSFSGGYSVAQAQGVAGGGATKVYSIVGDNTDLGAAGSKSVAASWTGSWPDAQALVLLVTAATSASGAAAPASTSARAAAGTRIVPGAAAPASTTAAAAAGHQIAHGTAAAASTTAAAAAGHGIAHAAAHPASVSAVTAVPNAHSRRTLRPDSGRTLRP